ncbi:MAG: hypothetical protein GDA51_09640 [Ekhidna sp.]|nr:hypothetical protein [Ekhidna sp.]MBC6426709.1 hypothetical protein [Ekhidna sp.]
MTNLLLVIHLLIHPFHVSVTEIKYKKDQEVIQISSRIFLDDLELALREYTGNDKLDITDESGWGFIEEHLGNYLLNQVRLWDEKGKPYELNYIGAEIEDDVMWCYIEIEKVKTLKQVKISNSILHEVWADQENLLHFRAFGRVKSARLFKGNETKVFEWSS